MYPRLETSGLDCAVTVRVTSQSGAGLTEPLVQLMLTALTEPLVQLMLTGLTEPLVQLMANATVEGNMETYKKQNNL